MKSKLDDVLDRIEDYFDVRHDTRDGPDGLRPNEPMQLLADLREAREIDYKNRRR